MSNKVILATSARGFRGSVMGSPQATTVLQLGIQSPAPQVLEDARNALALQLPRWIAPSESSCQSTGSMAHTMSTLTLLAELIQALQLEAGIAVGRALPVHPADLNEAQATLYLPTQHPKATEIAINASREILNHLLGEVSDYDWMTKLDEVRHQLKPFAEKGVNSFFILQAAFELGIPVFRPVQGLLVLGTGSRSRWLQSLISDETPMLGAQFAQGKHVTAALLRTAGLPGGTHHLVKTREQAMQAAQALGYPVVVKPADADRGAGVAAGLTEPLSVALAFDAAVKVSRNVLVERWVPGNTHRLTVQDGRVIRVVRRVAGGVVGDGEHTIEDLVRIFQQTPQQQRFARRLGYQPLSLDEEALSLLGEQGLTVQSRPDAGVYVKLRRRDNVNAGGTNEELPPDDESEVHSDNIRLAVAAARVLRLDFAGIDFITTDISRSWLEVGGVICEVNARPQMGGTNDPGLYHGVLKRLFPQGATVPAELLLVPQDEAQQANTVQRLMQERSGVAVSLASGLWTEGQQCTPAFKHSFEAAQSLLQRREVSHAVCCMTVQDIDRYGLPMPGWEVVRMMADAVFTPAEAEIFGRIRGWLQAAVRSA